MPTEWPRQYTSAEIEAIARSIAREKPRPLAVDMLQEAVESYQRASAADQDDWLN